MPQVSWEFIHHGRDEPLHGAELGVQAQEHQHEEEEAGPEGGEGHLQDSARVGQESKSRAWESFIIKVTINSIAQEGIGQNKLKLPAPVFQTISYNKNFYRQISLGHVTQFGDSLVIAFLSA